MALSARELLLILRAKDEISGTLHQVSRNMTLADQAAGNLEARMMGIGTAMLGMGSLFTAAGVGSLGFFNKATSDAENFQKEVTYALTQATRIGATFDDLSKITLGAAKDIAVPITELNDGLYDIFSTVDVTVPQAETMLRSFAKAAVAGDAEIRDVARTTMGILNTFNLPLEETNRILDTQFRLVEFGAGTYSEFVNAIGRNIPTTKAAGQDFEQLAGMMAFLTRAGVPLSNATSSVGRALELITKPKAWQNLEQIGVAVRNSKGEFKQVNEIITDMAQSKGWAAMTEPQRKIWFEEIFGTGTIQARRFFDTAIPNFELFNRMVDEMGSASGAVDAAYALMADTAIAKTQQLQNNYEALRIEIGQQLLPAKLRLMETLMQVIDAWNGLSESTRHTIVRIAAVSAVILTVVGVLMVLVGSFLLFAAVVAPVVGGIGSLLLIMAGIPALLLAVGAAVTFVIAKFDGIAEKLGIAAISAALIAFGLIIGGAMGAVAALVGVVVAAGYLIYRNWDTIKSALASSWNFLKDAWAAFMAGFTGEGSGIDSVIGLFARLGEAVRSAWDFIRPILVTIVDGFKGFWSTLNGASATSDGFVGAMEKIGAFLRNDLIPAIQNAWDKFISFSSWLISVAGPIIVAFAQAAWASIKTFADFLVNTAIPAVISFGQFLWQGIEPAVNWLVNTAAPAIIGFARSALDAIQSFVNWVKDDAAPGVQTGVDAILSLFQTIRDKLSEFWNWFSTNFGPGFKEIFDTISREARELANEMAPTINAIIDTFRRMWTVIGPIVETMINFIVNKFQSLYNSLMTILPVIWNYIKATWDNILAIIKIIMPIIVDAIVAAWNVISAAISAALTFIGNVISIGWNLALSVTIAIWNLISSFVSNAITVVSNIIRLVMNLIQGDWQGAWQNILNILNAAINFIQASMRAGMDLVRAIASAAWEAIKLIFSSAASRVIQIISELAANLRAKGTEMINGFLQAIRSAFTSVIAFFNTVRATILGVFAGAGQWLVNAGANIVNGLIGGLKSKLNTLRETANSIGSTVKNAVSSFLRIQSPSKVMFEFGQMTMEGFDLGLKDKAVKIQPYLDDLMPKSSLMPSELSNVSMGDYGTDSSRIDKALIERLIETIENLKTSGINVEGDLVLGSSEDIDELDYWTQSKLAGI